MDVFIKKKICPDWNSKISIEDTRNVEFYCMEKNFYSVTINNIFIRNGSFVLCMCIEVFQN